ncbi:MAG: Maleylpyruvate isomerase, mycothiol-dependent, partial [uncultured Blastococcus sp.]
DARPRRRTALGRGRHGAVRGGHRRPRRRPVRGAVRAARLGSRPRGRPSGCERRRAAQPRPLGEQRRGDPDVLLTESAHCRHRDRGDPATVGAALVAPPRGDRAGRRSRSPHEGAVAASRAHRSGPRGAGERDPLAARPGGDGARRRRRAGSDLRRPATGLPRRTLGRHHRQARRGDRSPHRGHPRRPHGVPRRAGQRRRDQRLRRARPRPAALAV